MQKFASMSPVISKVDEFGNRKYLFYETHKLGPIRYTCSYPVSIELSNRNRTITMRAAINKYIRINFIFVIVDAVDYSVIEETVEYESIIPLKPIFFYLLKKQHQKLFLNINDLEED